MSTRLRIAREQALEEKEGMDISSLVDVAFLLLIYFLVTSTLMPRESDLGLALAPAFDTVPPALPPLDVEINEAGAILVDGEEVEAAGSGADVPNFVTLLERHALVSRAANSEPVVIFNPAEKAAHQRFVDVLNAVSGADIKEVLWRQ